MADDTSNASSAAASSSSSKNGGSSAVSSSPGGARRSLFGFLGEQRHRGRVSHNSSSSLLNTVQNSSPLQRSTSTTGIPSAAVVNTALTGASSSSSSSSSASTTAKSSLRRSAGLNSALTPKDAAAAATTSSSTTTSTSPKTPVRSGAAVPAVSSSSSPPSDADSPPGPSVAAFAYDEAASDARTGRSASMLSPSVLFNMRDRSKTGLVSESHVRVVVSDQVLGQAFLRFLKLDAAGGRIVIVDSKSERMVFTLATPLESAQVPGVSAIVMLYSSKSVASVSALLQHAPTFLPSTRDASLKHPTPILIVDLGHAMLSGDDASGGGSGGGGKAKEVVVVVPAHARALVEVSGGIAIQATNDSTSVLLPVCRVVQASRALEDNPYQDEIRQRIEVVCDSGHHELLLRKRALKALPPEILSCKFLRRLRLHGNELKTFPSLVLMLPMLTELDLNTNQINSVPENIVMLSHLQSLDLSNNRIRALPVKELASMHALKNLRIKGNPLNLSPEELAALVKLSSMSSVKDMAYTSSLRLQQAKKKRTGGTKERRENLVFGVAPERLLEIDVELTGTPSVLPRFFQRAIVHVITAELESEGVFRIAGAKNRMIELTEGLNSGTISNFNKDEPAGVIPGLLKQFLRELPEPLLTYEEFDAVRSIAEKNWEEQKQVLEAVLQRIPEVNAAMFQQLCRLLYIISRSSQLNRMDASNLAKVIGPNILGSKDTTDYLQGINAINDVLTCAIEHYPELFEQGVAWENRWNDALEESASHPCYAILHRKLQGHVKSISCMCLAVSDTRLWTGDSKGVFRIWDTETYQLVTECDTERRSIYAMTCVQIADIETVWLGTRDDLQIRDAKTGELLVELPTPAYNLCLVNNSEVWVGDAGAITIYDIHKRSQVAQITVPAFVTIMTVVDGAVWSVCSDKHIRIYDSKARVLVTSIDTLSRKLNSITLVGDIVWSTSDDGTISQWNKSNRQLIAHYSGIHSSKSFGATAVGSKVWTYAWDRSIHVWSAQTNKPEFSLPTMFHNDAVSGIVAHWSKKHECWQVISSSWDRSVIVWLVRPE